MKKLFIALMTVLCIAALLLGIYFNAINDYLICNGYQPAPSYNIILFCLAIAILYLSNNFKYTGFITFKIEATVILASYLLFLFLTSQYTDYSYFSHDRETTPISFKIFIFAIIVFCMILWLYLQSQSKESQKHSRIIAIMVVLIGIAIPFSFSYDKHWIDQYYHSHIQEVIDEASRTSSGTCNKILKMYFRYDELIGEHPHQTEVNYGDYHPYLFERTAYDMCNRASRATIYNEYDYCLNGMLDMDLENEKNRILQTDERYLRERMKIEYLTHNYMLKDFLICMDYYRKQHPEKDKEALEYAKNKLVEHGFAVDASDLRSYCQSEYFPPHMICDYLTVDKPEQTISKEPEKKTFTRARDCKNIRQLDFYNYVFDVDAKRLFFNEGKLEGNQYVETAVIEDIKYTKLMNNGVEQAVAVLIGKWKKEDRYWGVVQMFDLYKGYLNKITTIPGVKTGIEESGMEESQKVCVYSKISCSPPGSKQEATQIKTCFIWRGDSFVCQSSDKVPVSDYCEDRLLNESCFQFQENICEELNIRNVNKDEMNNKQAADIGAEKREARCPQGMVFIPAGSFTMGCSPDDSNCEEEEKPAREVFITRAFCMDEHEVTQGEFEALMGENPSRNKNCGYDCPVESVSQYRANKYCMFSCKRLPTEAEWEYAARAGAKTKYFWGRRNSGSYAWYAGNSTVYEDVSGNCDSCGKPGIHPAKTKKPNRWGLYDMLGNVMEWVSDCYDVEAYLLLGDTNPVKTDGDCSNRVLRGGNFGSQKDSLSVSHREANDFSNGISGIGFRCAADIEPDK